MLRVRGLSVSYSQREHIYPVLEGVSFDIQSGQALGLVGESGCGKTTVAMALMGYLPTNGHIDAGEVSLGGRDLFSLSSAELRTWRGSQIAMVYQEAASALNPAMRVGDQIAEVIRFHERTSWAGAHRRAHDMAERVALPDPDRMLRSYPHQLSGGQQQRVVIAMALACDPKLLILDEPTTGLDATVEAQVLDLIAALRVDFDATILFISHNLGLVRRLCDRVAVLYAGRIVELGAAREVFESPRHPYTLGLVRCVPRFGTSKRSERLQPIKGSLPAPGASLPGCRYQPRCPLARARCLEAEPPLAQIVETDGQRSVRCFFSEDVARARVTESPNVASANTRSRRSSTDVTPLVEITGLSARYKDVLVCADVSLTISRGETVGLVGESGSGKTTLALALAGLVEPSAGEVTLEGGRLARKVSKRTTAVRRSVQMVFQNPDATLNPHHRIRYILARAIKRLRGESTASELGAAVRLRRRQLEAKGTELSGGEKQRVAIGRAFAGTPQLVLCDEPASALDVSVQAAVLNLFIDLQAEHDVTYVFISHDLAVIHYIADRIAVMYAGQLVELGGAEQVISPPHHPYTEALVSAIPTLDAGPGRERIRLEGTVPSLRQPPTGCRFHTRCPRKIGPICETLPPPWQEATDGHRIRCHYTIEQLQALQGQGPGLGAVERRHIGERSEPHVDMMPARPSATDREPDERSSPSAPRPLRWRCTATTRSPAGGDADRRSPTSEHGL